ncbi:MAG: signal peptidase I [Bacteroidetes bacterium RIFOXYA12_FULL_35_11]|nr:MAG: signal peptidase I [Bacteroidetes bacterium GWF2_35_48]OFY76038.1 MAG: signal peptidase I [Bacteroidetes bacterium RIFOXYA12_FULL_35_11]OFY96968.1 MAG: signal peptidase I [Bacteroidetes bacterium RIFOXYB2_FULL_35_7]HBX51460.1 signal peptidase I [Bacteroidales bacterium]
MKNILALIKEKLSFLRNKYVKFGIAIAVYILWVIWVGNFWLLFGCPIIFDLHITKKVHWAFWKKKNVKKQPKLIEWIDALIFAVVAATFIRMFFIEAFTIPTSSMEKTLLIGDYLFVSKASYGPKIPNTPLSFPFAHHTLPLTQSTKSYLEWIKWPYKRLAGLSEIKNDDIVVFNFPEGDTVCQKKQEVSYYQLVRAYGRQAVTTPNPYTGELPFGEIVVRPVDKRENYIKRCVAIPGDSLKIIHGQVYINGKRQEIFDKMQFNYYVETDGSQINPKMLEKLDISRDDVMSFSNYKYSMPLTYSNLKTIKSFSNVKRITRAENPTGNYDNDIFPHSPVYHWNVDNFGPLWIPKKGATAKLTIENLPIYERIIDQYEGNDLKIEGNKIFINGKETDSYTFKLDYYWMMGDNRHMSADSRFWGFVPEDHIVGKAVFIWLSLDKNKSFFSSIRWSRMFRFIHR